MRSCVFVKATCGEMRDFELGRTRGRCKIGLWNLRFATQFHYTNTQHTLP